MFWRLTQYCTTNCCIQKSVWAQHVLRQRLRLLRQMPGADAQPGVDTSSRT